MPNHIKNRIQLSGNREQIELLKKHMVGFPYDGETSDDRKSIFDFNKIIERPNELDITSDGWISLLENQFSWNEPLKSNLDRHRLMDNFKYDEYIEKSIDNFAQGIKNYLKYGHASWYGWSCENWGTKWNSYCIDKEWIDDSITFETAWSNVGDLIMKLSGMFPLVDIYYSYSDEDSGCNCGQGLFKNGDGVIEKFENESEKAWNMFFELHPNDKENYIFKNGTYEYKDEDEI